MDEASKTQKIRPKDFATRYLGGKVLDIGAGRDLVCKNAESFDIEHGDANHILNYKEKESYDCVHSSHCLEHMFNPDKTIKEWWELVKPNGFLIVVVPDEDLYEQNIWPAFFNTDHKATFRLDKKSTWSPRSFDMLELCKSLPKSEIIEATQHDHNYKYELKFPNNIKPKKLRGSFFSLLRSIIKRIPFIGNQLKEKFENYLILFGYPVDQTGRKDVLAQIQVIVKKKA